MTTRYLRTIGSVALAGIVAVPVPLAGGQARGGAPENSMVETIATLPSSGPTENVTQTADGAFYVTGLDDHVVYKVTGGRVETFATLPQYAAIVGVAPATDGVVLTVFAKPYKRPGGQPGADFSDVAPEVVVLDRAGKVIAAVAGQKGQAFNGIAAAGNGIYFIADTAASILWRFDAGRRQLESWVKDVPGANGIKVLNGWVYVTTRDGIQRVQINPGGQPGPLTMFAKGVRGDDFAITKDGTIYIPGGMGLVRVSAQGEASTVMENTPGGAGAITSNDGRWIYWATRGGDKPQRLVRVTVR